jgi:hypothetical protein
MTASVLGEEGGRGRLRGLFGWTDIVGRFWEKQAAGSMKHDPHP